MQKSPKIIFWGTPEFADTIFKDLLAADLNIVAAVTQPDKPKGRKNELHASAVKLTAFSHKIPVLQPENLKSEEFLNSLRSLGAEIFVVAAYGKIIPQVILDIPARGAINVHPSLLPRYRGASPVLGALLNGDSETGVSLILMDNKMDHGPILAQEKFKIAPDDTNFTLHNKLAPIAARMLVKAIPAYLDGSLKPQAQDESLVTLTRILNKDDGRINWTQSAEQICRQIRAYNPWPLSWTVIAETTIKDIKGKKLLIHEALPTKLEKTAPEGTVLIHGTKMFVRAGNQAPHSWIEVKQLQLEARKEIDAASFVRGYQNFNESVLK